MLESMVFDYVSGKESVTEEQISSSMARFLKANRDSAVTPVDRLVWGYLSSKQIGGIHSHITGSRLFLRHEFALKFVNVLFVRDPFKRFVSGLVDKHIDGSFSHIFRPKSFRDAASKIGLLEPHHFDPQTAGAYIPDLKYDRVFDIENIDYEYLSGLLGMSVRPRVMNRKSSLSGPCREILATVPYERLVELKSADALPDHDCFYDDESRRMVGEYYRGDFDLMRRWLTPSDA